MTDLAPYISAAAVATTVSGITGNAADAAAAGGYAAFISSIAGGVPVVAQGPDGTAIVSTTPDQKIALTRWLDKQVKGIVSVKGEQPSVQYDIDDVLVPWSMKYVAPVLIGAFVAGWLGSYFFAKRR